jgi:hypothetical protein
MCDKTLQTGCFIRRDMCDKTLKTGCFVRRDMCDETLLKWCFVRREVCEKPNLDFFAHPKINWKNKEWFSIIGTCVYTQH